MGYRSTVAIAFTDHAVRLLDAIAGHIPELAELIAEAERQTINDCEDDKGGKLYWDYIKWYDGYNPISALEQFLCCIPDEDFHFLRLGEEPADIEERGGFYESEMYVNRSIEW